MLFIVFILSPVSVHSDSTSEEARIPPPAYKVVSPGSIFMQRKLTYKSVCPSVSSQPVKPE